MATTLNITPTLKGRESRQFNVSISKDKIVKVSKERKNEMFALVAKVMAKKA